MKEFNPSRFDPEEWADLMLSRLQVFMITSKHHDGSVSGTPTAPSFKVTNTAYKRDLLASSRRPCATRHQTAFLLLVLDWTHPRTAMTGRRTSPTTRARSANSAPGSASSAASCSTAIGRAPISRLQKKRNGSVARSWDWPAPTADHELHQRRGREQHARAPLPGEDYQVWNWICRARPPSNSTHRGRHKPKATVELELRLGVRPAAPQRQIGDTILTTMRAVHQADAVFLLNVGPRRSATSSRGSTGTAADRPSVAEVPDLKNGREGHRPRRPDGNVRTAGTRSLQRLIPADLSTSPSSGWPAWNRRRFRRTARCSGRMLARDDRWNDSSRLSISQSVESAAGTICRLGAGNLPGSQCLLQRRQIIHRRPARYVDEIGSRFIAAVPARRSVTASVR